MRDRLIELIADFTEDLSARDLHKADFDEKFADHLLAEGVIVPPCKVGDTVYKTLITDDTNEPAIWEIIIKYGEIDMRAVSEKSYLIGRIKDTHCGVDISFCEFGKNAFLTREEAEKALERSENGKS